MAGLSAAGVVASTVPAGAATGPTWPVSGRVSQLTGASHPGVDIGAPVGTPVYAAQDGIVTAPLGTSGYGCNVVIDHGGGWTTVYAHMSETSFIAGTAVRRGALVGRSGGPIAGACSGNSSGPHLHFEFDLDGTPVRGWERDAISSGQGTTAKTPMPAPAGFPSGPPGFNDGQILARPAARCSGSPAALRCA